jgi:riboflavin kinase/FMN adenylyltransferase
MAPDPFFLTVAYASGSDRIHMTLLHGFQQPEAYRGGYVAIGNFDGVHRGHQRMVHRLVERSRAEGVSAVVLTFDPPPGELLRPGKMPPRLSTLERKVELLTRHGVDTVVVYPTDLEFLNLDPVEFFRRFVERELDACGLVEGPNFFFGRDRQGDVTTLRKLCESSGRSLEVVEPLVVDGEMVSSSRIRRAVSAGDLRCAVQLLGHQFRVRGRVVRGEGRGRGLGWPTANLADVETLLPADGVYAGVGHVGDRVLPAAVHLGPNPTFGERQRKLEVHLVGFHGELYGEWLSVDLLEQVRGTEKFPDVHTLQTQLRKDVAAVQSIAERHVSG